MYVQFVRTNQIRPLKVVPGSWWVLLATCPVLPKRMRMYDAVCTDKLFVHSHGAKAPKSIPLLSVRVCTYILYGRLVRTLRRRYVAPKCAGETVLRFPPSPSPPGNHAEKFQEFKYINLSLTTTSAVARAFAFRLSWAVGREGWALCVHLDFGVHFIDCSSII